jgi:dTDP-4-amino-4,6-dideoxygalactose transaminase
LDKIPFARPFTGVEEEEAVLRVLRSGWLTTGPEALAFEREFAAFLGGGAAGDAAPMMSAKAFEPKAFAVNSATSGLHLAVKAVGVKAGDVVLVPSFTFTATAEVVRYERADVVFVDVEKGGFLIDPESWRQRWRGSGRGRARIKTAGPAEGRRR